jgi:hypothetical protein
MTLQQVSYPVQFDVDYPDEPLSRASTLFRMIYSIPIFIILSFASSGILIAPLLLMILFKQKYPRWWFDWNLAMTRFSNRVGAYASLLRDEYPSTDEEQAVHLNMAYPDAAGQLNRWMPLIKWFLVTPHVIVLSFLGVASFIAIILAWFAILFTGRYPRGLFNFVVGVMRWSLRVEAYAILMVTDEYLPFRLSE